MRETQAGFATLCKAADAAAENFKRRPEIAQLFLILESWGEDPLTAPDALLRVAQSYLQVVRLNG